ncbi:hypothetical protein HDU93_003558 [Gonapodya sp. JEL0774]|nr:hypothetical protein HDU93_003558 [Gonapodya sp. JEL0774]
MEPGLPLRTWQVGSPTETGSQRKLLLPALAIPTGTTASYAQTLASFARSRGIAVRVQDMKAFTDQWGTQGVVKGLAKEGNVVLMTSTFYNGEFPDNALSFWTALSKADPSTAPALLANTKFAIFGLGNKSNKSNFNLAARRLEQRIKELGGREFVPAGYGDELAASSHESSFRPFLKSIWSALSASSTATSLPSSYTVSPAPQGAKDDTAAARGEGFREVRVTGNKVLSGKGVQREIRLVSVAVEGGETYPLAGHVLVSVPNPSSLVSRAIRALALGPTITPTTLLSITPTTASSSSPLPATTTLSSLLTHHIDLQGLATRSFLEALSVVATDKREKERLQEIAEGMGGVGGDGYARLTEGEIFSYVDAMEMFPSARLSIDQLMSIVPRIQPRYYSISSSPLAQPSAIDIIICKDVWPTLSNPENKFQGLASSYLSGLKNGDKVLLKWQESPVKVDAGTKVVAVGLGTGIGVPRGILQHFSALKKQGKPVVPMELFYGFRHAEKDLVLEDELRGYETEGLCTLSFSAMDQGSLVTAAISKTPTVASTLLDNNGIFLYTGPGGVVPQAVEVAVQESIATTRSIHPQSAASELADLKADPSRWIVEAYSREADVENLLKSYTTKLDSEKPLASVFEGIAALQDLLVDVVKRLGWVNHQIRTLAGSSSGLNDSLLNAVNSRESDKFTMLALFSTLTNVNFDPASIRDYIVNVRYQTAARTKVYNDLCKSLNVAPNTCPIPDLSGNLTDPGALAKKGELVGVLAKFRTVKNDVVVGLAEMLVYGLKGVCAYGDHAVLLGEEDARVFNYLNEALAFLISPESANLDAVVQMLLRCGEANLITMDTLHRANTKHGAQSPASVTVGPTPGKAILISGHDMKYLEELLEQTKGTGVNVYTHGEMLPAHGYPKLRDYGNLVGHFGVAWQRQTVEFPHFPGPIVMTSNCLVPPKDDLKDRIFTAGAVAYPGCPTVDSSNYDFSAVIKKAQEMTGFRETDTEFTYPLDPFGKPAKSYNVGFAYETVLSVAPQVISAIEKGDITRFYYIGGCDGFEGERNYYTELMENLPPTSVVLTSGCGKYRVLGDKLQYATIGDTGIPRLLDLGQCNDAYSAIKIAVALAEHFKCGVNDLPLNLVVSWFEQKAVAILLTLLHLNLKGVRIGPRLPAFIRPAALEFLVKTFDLKAIGDAQEDLKAMTGQN